MEGNQNGEDMETVNTLSSVANQDTSVLLKIVLVLAVLVIISRGWD